MPNTNPALLIENGYPELAIPRLEEQLSADPQNWEYNVNIGVAYRLTSQFQLALLHQTLATQLKPDQAPAWHNLGVTLTELGDFDRAYVAHRTACSLSPYNQQMLLALAYALMRYGKFEEAWPLWEAARYHKYFWEIPGIPLWNGKESLEGKKLLVTKEGGYGDAILFLRWIAELQDRGAETFLQTTDEQAGLFVGHPWINHVVTEEEPINPKNYDFSISMLSLPALLNCKADAIPAAERYIVARPEKVSQMREIVSRGTRPLVGICWGAEEGLVPKRSRTISDREIEPLKEADVQWISLWPGHKLPWMEYVQLVDWSDTAALITHLDAVVSVDTAVAHIAGAMGQKTQIITPLGSDWKFFRNLTTSPWYPSVELIRNDSPTSWAGAVQKALIGIQRLHRVPDGINPEHGDSSSAAVG